MVDIKEHILELAKKTKGRIVLPESFDARVLRAAQIITEDGIGSVVLPVSDVEEIKSFASKAGINLSGVDIVEIDKTLLDEKMIMEFVDGRVKKGMSAKYALELLQRPLYFSMMYLKSRKCDACVCGAVYDTADVLRAGIHVIGTSEDIKMISSYFLMIPPNGHPIAKDPVIFADCGVNPDPQPVGLRDIVIATVGSFKKIFPGRQANVAMLSFSTKGSSKSKVLSKVIEATRLVKNYFAGQVDVSIDGELQFDTSVILSVGKKKAPDSPVAGNANILIFPDLNAGNIAYKIAERYGGFQALGPIIQGLSLPVSDLSRGVSTSDICLVSAIMLIK
jgi:phosphate acetyltransferase